MADEYTDTDSGGEASSGRLPEAVRAQVESEAPIVYLAEGVLETARFRHYKAPGFRILHRWMGFIGYFVLSERRMIVKAGRYNKIDINVAYDEPLFQKMTFAVKPRYLSLAFDASAQNEQASDRLRSESTCPTSTSRQGLLSKWGHDLCKINWGICLHGGCSAG